MGQVRIPLDEQQEAHLGLILDLYKQDMAQIDGLKQQAESRKDGRLSTIAKALKVPDGVVLSAQKAGTDQPCFLVYEDVERVLKLEDHSDHMISDQHIQDAVLGLGGSWGWHKRKDALWVSLDGKTFDLNASSVRRFSDLTSWIKAGWAMESGGTAADGISQASEKSTALTGEGR